MDDMHELSVESLSALCSNLAKACSKQLRTEEASLFDQLASYYKSKSKLPEGKQFTDYSALVLKELNKDYAEISQQAAADGDRGSLRALTWGEKVSKILKSLLDRYEKQKDSLLENTNVFVCEICGFIYIGNLPPEICPICKVPGFKMMKIQKVSV